MSASAQPTGLGDPKGSEPSGLGATPAIPCADFQPSQKELTNEALCGPDLENTLQVIYDEEVNVGITTMWDGGFDLSIGGAPGWTDPLLRGCVYGSHNIAPWLRLAFNRAYASVDTHPKGQDQ